MKLKENNDLKLIIIKNHAIVEKFLFVKIVLNYFKLKFESIFRF